MGHSGRNEGFPLSGADGAAPLGDGAFRVWARRWRLVIYLLGLCAVLSVMRCEPAAHATTHPAQEMRR